MKGKKEGEKRGEVRTDKTGGKVRKGRMTSGKNT